MQELMAFIDEQKQEFAKLPLFDFMLDKSIDLRQRLSFAPCMAHFIMSFGDLNKYVFRANKPDDRIQEIINGHTNEDDHHWSWFITDLEKLGFNPTENFTEALQFIWGEETKITRQIAYIVAGYTLQAEPIIKLAAIEALESMGNVFFSISSQVTSELQAITNKKYIYFGDTHLNVETGHVVSTPDGEKFIAEIELTDSQRQQAFEVVKKVFQIFTQWTYELLVYAKTHNLESANKKSEATLMVSV
ncbi:hypothetical protein OGM63_19385 [Plectonema radiosum NIES-515]|uniref:Uncharacterized protein n=1 Tax=Plectonema radiosum NIES-515 TaxID=2986073 RepID=A0ABT3B2P4_9CYAN|nr:hypothetical protein [Plectonema radiosum]MCV3215648.1 hypothetical protein [Plectonema radiosum NIES-515]